MPFGVISGVGPGMGLLDGSGDRRRERSSFGGKCGASHCNQWNSLREGAATRLFTNYFGISCLLMGNSSPYTLSFS